MHTGSCVSCTRSCCTIAKCTLVVWRASENSNKFERMWFVSNEANRAPGKWNGPGAIPASSRVGLSLEMAAGSTAWGGMQRVQKWRSLPDFDCKSRKSHVSEGLRIGNSNGVGRGGGFNGRTIVVVCGLHRSERSIRDGSLLWRLIMNELADGFVGSTAIEGRVPKSTEAFGTLCTVTRRWTSASIDVWAYDGFVRLVNCSVPLTWINNHQCRCIVYPLWALCKCDLYYSKNIICVIIIFMKINLNYCLSLIVVTKNSRLFIENEANINVLKS